MSKTKNILVCNGQYIDILFFIPVVINLQGHRFEVYTLVSEIHDNIDTVMRIKNLYEVKGAISIRDSCLLFLNRSIPSLPKTDVLLKPGKQRYIKIKMPLIDEISGLAMIRIHDLRTGCTNTIKGEIYQECWISL